MDANISAPRFMPSMPFENGSVVPPYPYPRQLHNQHPFPHPPSQPNAFNVPNNHRFDANWLASFPPPLPPPPPMPFAQGGPPLPFDISGHPAFSQMHFLAPNAPASHSNTVSLSSSLQANPQIPSRDHAKEALLAMIRAEITYNDIVAEGVKAPLLDTLFTELNLPLPKPASDPTETLDPAMERKDRIAKLLAAKKNQGAASPKEAAHPIESASTPELVSRKPTPPPSPPEQVAREEKRSGFSIPGLFMTSAEQEEFSSSLTSPEDPETVQVEHLPTGRAKNDETVTEQSPAGFAISAEHTVPTSDSEDVIEHRHVEIVQAPVLELKSMKRGPEPFAVEIMPQSKRQVSISRDVVLPTSSEKAAESALTAGRSKVNQNILKDRMAALKADLQLKNSRKQALQDGMPVLNAEVQKTRERLQHNENRLRDVRAEIIDKSAELIRLREEEARLGTEVQRLKDQLADGETGQQQFSNELTQLNDQIMADENESRDPRNSNLLSSPIAGRIDPSVQSQLLPNRTHGFESTASLNPVSQEPSRQEHDVNMKEQQFEIDQVREHVEGVDTEDSHDQDDIDRQLNDETAYTIANTQSTTLDPSTSIHDTNGVTAPSFSTTAESLEVGSEHDSDDDKMSIDEAEELESIGSASMSDSGSDEYEPPVHLDSDNELDEEEGDDYEPQEIDGEVQESSNDADNDDYEPLEQVDVLNVDTLEVLRREEDDRPTSATDPGDSSMHADIPPLEVITTSSPHVIEEQLTLTPAPEVLIPKLPTVSMEKPLSNSAEGVPTVPHFVPYFSPLSNMKQFRFNSQFNGVVKDGYRSLTYSHQIDKDIPLCPTELSGILCIDGHCEEQHFSKFALSGTLGPPKLANMAHQVADSTPDDRILVQMSSANHIKDKAQRDRYLIGLKKVIADLRERGVKEFSEVANALATYRRDQATSQDGLPA